MHVRQGSGHVQMENHPRLFTRKLRALTEDRPVRKIYSDYKIGKNSYKMVFPDIAV